MTLNLTGSSNSNIIKNITTTKSLSPTSPYAKTFPSISPPPSASSLKSQSPTNDLDSQPPSLVLNGSTSKCTTKPTVESVTVTHFSEKRGTMEKISVPSLNIFNAEFKNDVNSAKKQSTNPFLNMSPVSTTSTITTSTNPFRSDSCEITETSGIVQFSESDTSNANSSNAAVTKIRNDNITNNNNDNNSDNNNINNSYSNTIDEDSHGRNRYNDSYDKNKNTNARSNNRTADNNNNESNITNSIRSNNNPFSIDTFDNAEKKVSAAENATTDEERSTNEGAVNPKSNAKSKTSFADKNENLIDQKKV